MASPAAEQVLTFRQMAALALKAGFTRSQAVTVAAIGMAESSGRVTVTSANPDGGQNTGWLQIDSNNAPGKDLTDPWVNVQVAKQMFDKDGFSPWQTWTQGTYRNFQPDAQAAVAAIFREASGPTPGGGGLGSVIDGILNGITGIPGDIGKGIGDIGKGIGNVVGLPKSVTDFFEAGEQLLHAGLWLLNPSHWVRILAGLAGVLLAGAGLYALAKAA
jgi:hypothetical protein